MKILGIDQSLTGTGFCWMRALDGGVISTISTGHACPGELRDGERLAWIRRWLLNELSCHPDMIVLEEPVTFAQGSVKALCGLYGVLLCTIAEWRATRPEVRLMLVNPRYVKMFGAGNGNAKKSQLVLAAEKRYPGVVNEGSNAEDEADALWLAEVARYIAFEIDGENEKRREAIAKVAAANKPKTTRVRRTASRKTAIKEAA